MPCAKSSFFSLVRLTKGVERRHITPFHFEPLGMFPQCRVCRRSAAATRCRKSKSLKCNSTKNRYNYKWSNCVISKCVCSNTSINTLMCRQQHHQTMVMETMLSEPASKGDSLPRRERVQLVAVANSFYNKSDKYPLLITLAFACIVG